MYDAQVEWPVGLRTAVGSVETTLRALQARLAENPVWWRMLLALNFAPGLALLAIGLLQLLAGSGMYRIEGGYYGSVDSFGPGYLWAVLIGAVVGLLVGGWAGVVVAAGVYVVLWLELGRWGYDGGNLGTPAGVGAPTGGDGWHLAQSIVSGPLFWQLLGVALLAAAVGAVIRRYGLGDDLRLLATGRRSTAFVILNLTMLAHFALYILPPGLWSTPRGFVPLAFGILVGVAVRAVEVSPIGALGAALFWLQRPWHVALVWQGWRYSAVDSAPLKQWRARWVDRYPLAQASSRYNSYGYGPDRWPFSLEFVGFALSFALLFAVGAAVGVLMRRLLEAPGTPPERVEGDVKS